MKIFEGKSPAERNKIILACVLGALALLSLIYTFGGMLTGGKKTTVNVTVTPTPTVTPTITQAGNLQIPTQDELYSYMTTTPVAYNAGSFFAPDAGRNIFAFYEPPAPTPYVVIPVAQATPTPFVEIPPPTPVPTPTPTVIISFITPQNVYAGSKGFRLEINGDKFTPDTYIFFNGVQLPTNFVSPQKLTADIPANLISGEGARQIEVRSPDGKLFSLPVQLQVQTAPRPQFQYIGLIARRNYNNDTAYFQESNKPTPFGARLNDVVGGRFRLISISSSEVIFEDTSLGFRHRLPLLRPSPGQTGSTDTRNTSGFSEDFQKGYPNYNPQIQQNPQMQTNQQNPSTQQNIPGIPNNIPRYVPPQQQRTPSKKIEDEDEDDEDGTPQYR